jgi:hypothetical protein
MNVKIVLKRVFENRVLRKIFGPQKNKIRRGVEKTGY